MNKMTEYRRLVNEAKRKLGGTSLADITVRLHSIKRLYVVAETTEQGSTSLVFTVKEKAERYRSELGKISKATGQRAAIKTRTATFTDWWSAPYKLKR